MKITLILVAAVLSCARICAGEVIDSGDIKTSFGGFRFMTLEQLPEDPKRSIMLISESGKGSQTLKAVSSSTGVTVHLDGGASIKTSHPLVLYYSSADNSIQVLSVNFIEESRNMNRVEWIKTIITKNR